MKCKNCKSVFTPKKFLQKFCLEKDECIKAFVEETKKKEWSKKKKQMKRDLLTLSDYLNAFQVIFNKYIRLRDKNELYCISCTSTTGKRDAGHFFSVGNYPSVRFDEDNTWSQCVTCNRYNGGNLHIYRRNLITKIGNERVNALSVRAHKERKYSIPEIEELIKVYKQKIKTLENEI